MGQKACLAAGEDANTVTPKLCSYVRSEFVKLWAANGLPDSINGNGHKQEPEPIETTVAVTKVEAQPFKDSLKPTGQGEPATEKQIKAIFAKARGQLGWDNIQLKTVVSNRYDCSIDELTKKQAGNLISYLAEKAKEEPYVTILKK